MEYKTEQNQLSQEDIAAEKEALVIEEASGHFSRLGKYFLIGSLMIDGVQYLISLLLQQLRPEWLSDTNISLVLSSTSMYLIGMPFMIYLLKRIPAVKLPLKPMKIGHFLLALLMSFPIVYGSNLIGVVLTGLIGLLKGSAVDNRVFDLVTDTNIWILILYVVIFAPIMEELIFRKLIVERTVRYGQGVAIVVSGVMFGLFHGNLNQFIYATMLGMFLAFLYVKTGDIRVTIGVHMVINFMGGVLSTLLLKAIKYEELLEISTGGSVEQLMEFYLANLPGWIFYMVYLMLIVTVAVAGLVLLIVFRKRFMLEQGEIILPKGKCFDTVFVNKGMLVFVLFWSGMILLQLL